MRSAPVAPRLASLAPLALLALLPRPLAAPRGSCAELGCEGSDATCSCASWCLSSADCCVDFEEVCPLRPARRLELGDVNLVVTTDLHSWIEGREHEPRLNATLGHAVSLVERLRERARASKRDVFFFDNGDINDGTGLSATHQNHVDHLAPVMRQAPYDALNIGNHELYQLDSRGRVNGSACAIAGLRDSGYIASWGGRYLTSNVVWAGSGEPVGSRFAVLRGDFGTQLLVFGFLYNMRDHCTAVEVEDVAGVVASEWFLEALRTHGASSSAVVVLAHMDYREPLVELILGAIRGALGGEKPVQVLAGHSHIRGFRRLDDHAAVYEAGCKLDTLGFVSLAKGGANGTTRISHLDLDGNTAVLAGAAGMGAEALLEPKGEAVNRALAAARERLGLGRELGCADRRYRVSVPVSDLDSLWAYYTSRVLPGALLGPEAELYGRPLWAVVGKGALSDDVYPGPFTLDDAYKASPFGNYWFRLPGLAGADLAAMLRKLNRKTGEDELRWPGEDEVPDYMATGEPDAGAVYDLVYCDFDAAAVEGFVRNLTGRAVEPGLFRPGMNTSSVLAEWFSRQLCPGETLHV